MKLELINSLLNEYDGNRSLLYPILEDKLKIYSCEELPFREEFLFFEEKYLTIKKHMIKNNIDGHILDIGCQLGIQSEIFLDNKSYTGLDIYPAKYFNQDLEQIKYLTKAFPLETNIDESKYIVMSIMSLGYFNNSIDENTDVALDIIVDNLKDAKHLYVTTTPELTERLKTHFNNIECLIKNKMESSIIKSQNSEFNTYYMSK